MKKKEKKYVFGFKCNSKTKRKIWSNLYVFTNFLKRSGYSRHNDIIITKYELIPIQEYYSVDVFISDNPTQKDIKIANYKKLIDKYKSLIEEIENKGENA